MSGVTRRSGWGPGAMRQRLLRGWLGAWIGLLSVGPVTGCRDLSTPQPDPPILYQADLRPVGGPGGPARVQGQLAAIVRGRSTEVGIALDAEPLEPLSWGLFEGTCEEPGDLAGAAGDYPPLTPEQSSVEILLGLGLEGGSAYHAAVTSQAEGIRQACGDLRRVEF